MNYRVLKAAALTAQKFAPFGDVIERTGEPDMIINQGLCGRFHDLATLDFGDGRAGISLFDAQPRELPYALDMVERHPMGSQAFVPISKTAFLVVVAEDENDLPVRLQAFVTKPGQAINLHRGVWHGVLAPLGAQGQYVVIDRIGDGENLQEHWFKTPYVVE